MYTPHVQRTYGVHVMSHDMICATKPRDQAAIKPRCSVRQHCHTEAEALSYDAAALAILIEEQIHDLKKDLRKELQQRNKVRHAKAFADAPEVTGCGFSRSDDVHG